VLSLGMAPLCNDYRPIGSLEPQMFYPLNLIQCGKCTLVQLDYIAPMTSVFPTSYPYRSGSTNALRQNFEDLASQCIEGLTESELVVDIGSA
jgi:hypothetical protein